jgi:hypothetical protein
MVMFSPLAVPYPLGYAVGKWAAWSAPELKFGTNLIGTRY